MTVSATASQIYQKAKSEKHGCWCWKEQWSKAMKEASKLVVKKIENTFRRIFSEFPQPTLAEKYNSEIHNVSGWMMSEKYNGVRAIWDGKNLKSRNGNIFHAPEWFIASLPENVALDGELWMGAGNFEQTLAEVKKKDGNWIGMAFMVFDVIQDGEAYRKRIELLNSLELPGHCSIIEQFTYQSEAHLQQYHDEIKSNGGEGVVLRNPSADYEYERSHNFLKYKSADDAEAVVTGYRMKKSGTVQSLICKFNGKIFVLHAGLNAEIKNNPPKIGEMVTFQYYGLTKAGKPNHARFVAARNYE